VPTTILIGQYQQPIHNSLLPTKCLVGIPLSYMGLTMVQELVSLSHGVSMIPTMARVLDQSDRRVYRSLTGRKPTRKIAVIWNPYRFQSRLLEAFRERLRSYSVARIATNV
jgi:DNA-binding transcriptional LysR family regulator